MSPLIRIGAFIILVLSTAAFADTELVDTQFADAQFNSSSAPDPSEFSVGTESRNGSVGGSTLWPQGLNLNYYAILLGPSLLNPSSFQPDLRGQPDRTRPVLIRNYLSLGYNLSDTIVVSATGNVAWQPVRNQALFFEDPFITVSDSSLFRYGPLNLYGDLRAYFPVSRISHLSRQVSGVQSFQSLTLDIPQSRFTLGLNGSVRANFYRRWGFGTDFELYLGPNVRYQLSPKVSLSLLYEWQAAHYVGTKFGYLLFAGSDLQPGVTWEISPKVLFNPYLTIPTFGPANLKSTSMGMLLSWNLI